MTGPEHYQAAEMLLRSAANHTTEHPADMRIAEITAVQAQAHAILALAAIQGAITLPVSAAREGWPEALAPEASA